MLDMEAIKQINKQPDQMAAMLLRLLGETMAVAEKLNDRVMILERFYANSRPPVRELVGGEGINVLQIEEKAIVTIDEDDLREQFPSLSGPVVPTVGIGRITSWEATEVVDNNGNPVQWTYEIQELVKTGVGYGVTDWGTNGYAGPAYNGMEHANNGGGQQMNGIDHDGELILDKDVAMQPIQVGAIVLFIVVPTTDDANEVIYEAWFSVANAVDGTCDAAA